MENTTNSQKVVNDVGQASLGQSSQGVLVQSYCNSVLAQPLIDLSGTPNLTKIQQGINDGIGVAKGHANDYLNNIQPLIITNVTNISNYFDLHSAVTTTLTPGSSKQDWLENLNVLLEQSQQYQSDANSVVLKLKTLNGNLGDDSANFSKIVSDLNTAVSGDNGILQSIDGQLSDLQGQIDGAIAGMALSGLTILGGALMVTVGAIADFVTAGTSTPLIIAGVAVIAVGVGGEVASAITFKNLNDQKNNLLVQKASLKSEVSLALGMSNGYSSLNNQAMAAMQAATQMNNAWGFLSSDLGSLISDLGKGIASDNARKIWLTAANGAIQKVQGDTNTIKQQMTGVAVYVAPSGSSLNNVLDSLVIQNPQYRLAA